MTKIIDSTNLGYLISKIKAAFWPKADVVQVSIDSTPTASSDNLVKSGGVYSALAVKYEKPANGIPASDLASGVIPTVPTALSQLSDDSTHRLVTDTEKSTWNGKQNALTFDSTPTANSTNPVTSGGVKSYVDGAIPTVPTISTDIQTDKASTTKTAAPSAVYNEVHPAFGSSQPAGGMLPNVLYKLGTLTGTVSISFAAATDSTIENEYKFTFTAGSTAPTITWPASITGWAGNCVEDGLPVITGGNYYEVSVMDGIALIAEVEA